MGRHYDSELVAAASARMIESLHGDGDHVFRDILQVVLETLESPVGFCGIIDDADGALVCACSTGELFEPNGTDSHSTRFPADTWGGMTGAILNDRRPQFCNNAHPVAPGGIAVDRSLGVPLVSRGRLIGSIHIANRNQDYGDDDLRLLEQITRPVGPALSERQDRIRTSREAERSQRELQQQIGEERRARQESQRTLEELERMHRDILDGTPAVIYVKDLQGGYRFVNRRYEELFHVSREEFLGQTDFDIFPADLAQKFRVNDEQVARTGHELTTREQAPHGNELHTYLSVKFPLQNTSGEIRAVAGISVDITDKLAMEHRLAHISKQTEIILDAIGDGVFGLDCEGLVTFVNPTAERLLGWSESELRGQSMQHWIGTQVVPVCDEREHPAEILCEDEESYFQTREGELLPVRFASRPLIVDGQQTGWVVTFRDLTEEREQQERERQRQEIERQHFDNERQLLAVRALQEELFPSKPPQVPGYEIDARNYPRKTVSGDFFDYIERPDGSLVIVLGDAAGHDLGAAVNMVEAHAVLHALLDCGVPLQEMIHRLNVTLCRHLNGRFVSLFVLRLQPGSGHIEFAGAGHDATLLRASGKVERLPSTGLVLGLEPKGHSPTFSAATLEPGDMALLLTDGFQEALSPDRRLFGRKRVFDAVKTARNGSAQEIIAHLKAEVDRHVAEPIQQDDLTAVVIRRLPTTEG
ncbi:MAG: SpoIIE family protein phosphatase [Planctomycetaceae bacterium]|nr:SpoIIE family protein phosphatase [Planctomycetaceae bacterium]